MKENTAVRVYEEFRLDPSALDEAETAPTQKPRRISYAHDLRTLGQVLEGYSIGDLKIEMHDDCYDVRGQKGGRNAEAVPFAQLLRQWFGANDRAIKATKKRGAVECRVSASDIDAADRDNQRKRQYQGEMPDAYSLSQILRGIGFYIDTRDGARLHRLTIENERVTLEYYAASGKPKQVEETLKFFYDYWVQMYLRRSDRWKPATLDGTSHF